MPASPEFRPLPGLIASARDRWALVGAFALIGLVLGYIAATLLPVNHTATTTLQIASDSGTTSSNVISPADAENIAMLAPQLDAIAEQYGQGLTGKEVEASLTVVNRPDTSLLDFTWTGESPGEAERGADIAAKVYLDRAAELAGAAVPGQPPTARPAAGIVLMGAEGRAEAKGLPPAVYLPVGLLAGLLLGFVAAYVAEVRKPRVHARYHLSVGDPRFRGRIARNDDPGDVAMLFMVPVRPADRVGIAVLGRRPEQLDAFAEQAIGIAEGAGVRSVVPADTSSVSGLRAAREFDGVFLLAREEQVSVADLEATLNRLEAASVRVFGVLTVSPKAGVRLAEDAAAAQREDAAQDQDGQDQDGQDQDGRDQDAQDRASAAGPLGRLAADAPSPRGSEVTSSSASGAPGQKR